MNIIGPTKSTKYITFAKILFKWVVFGSLIGVLLGCTSALLINVNDYLTEEREANSWFLYFLPLGGLLIGYMYKYYGKEATKGNDLIFEQINEKKTKIPLAMGPIVFLSSFLTHLFGGSTGREGAAIQMGGSITDGINRIFKLNKTDQKILLLSGISGAFGSAFGLPLTGTLFGMEVVAIGRMKYEALIPCFVSSFVGYFVTNAWGVNYEEHIIQGVPGLSAINIGKIIVLGIIFGLVSIFYSEMKHHIRILSMKYLKNPMIIGFLGGLIIIVLVWITGTRDYTGRGLKMVNAAFDGTVPYYAFFAKIVFTAVTMGMGFRGGELIPLFFIGATLGNTLSSIFILPRSFLAAIGLVTVTGASTNTPISFFVLAVEMFHGEGIEFFFIAILVSFIFSGHHSIYSSQKIYDPKSTMLNLPNGKTISYLKIHKKI